MGICDNQYFVGYNKTPTPIVQFLCLSFAAAKGMACSLETSAVDTANDAGAAAEVIATSVEACSAK